MSLTKLLICALLTNISVIITVGQDRVMKEPSCPQNEAIERKDDRFSGEATVKLKPQPIDVAAPNQRLKMSLEYKVRPKGRGTAESFIPGIVDVVFTSESTGRIYGREAALVFLVDGERIRPVPGAVHDDYSRLSAEKILKQTVFTGMTAETLRRVSRAKTVEMKVGSTEVKLKAEMLDVIRSFARCALENN
jgi:hypothetical protein